MTLPSTSIDNQERVLSVNVDPAVENVTFAYDPKGRLARTGQGDKAWTFGYDSKNRLTSLTDPLDHLVQYGYDDADLVTQVILPTGVTFGGVANGQYQFTYDSNFSVTGYSLDGGAPVSLFIKVTHCCSPVKIDLPGQIH